MKGYRAVEATADDQHTRLGTKLDAYSSCLTFKLVVLITEVRQVIGKGLGPH